MGKDKENFELKILPKDKDKVDVPNGSSIKLQLEATKKDKTGYRYYWDASGESKDTSSYQVLIVLPGWYCGRPIRVDAVYKKVGIFSSIMMLWSKSKELESQLSAQRTFYPQCPPKIVSVEWYDPYLYMKYDGDLLVSYKGYVLVEVEGMNGVSLEAEFAISGRKVYTYKKGEVIVSDNYALFPFQIELKFVVGIMMKKAKATLTILNSKIRRTIVKDVLLEDPFKLDILRPTIQPAMVGIITINENNHKPCRYSRISVEDPKEDEAKVKRKCILFNEAVSNKIQPFPLIAGMENRKIKVKIDEYSVEKCKEKPKHKKKGILKSPKESKPIDVDLPGGKYDIEANYDYGKWNRVVPIFCVLPSFILVSKRYYLKVPTCRHDQEVQLRVYPDVKWMVGFKVSLDRGGEAGQKKKFSLDFMLKMAAEWNIDGGKREEKVFLSPKGFEGSDGFRDYVEKQLKQQFDVYFTILTSLINFLATYTEAQELFNSEAGSSREKPVFRQRKVATLDILWPSFHFDFTWRAGVHGLKVGLVGEVRVVDDEDSRIIGLSATFDLLALASKIPQLRLVVPIIDLMAWAANAEVNFELVVTGEIKIAGTYSFNTLGLPSSGEFNTIGEVRFELKLEFTVNAKETQIVNTRPGDSGGDRLEETHKKYGAGGKGEAGIQAILDIFPQESQNDNEGDTIAAIFSAKFTGLKLTLYSKTEVTREGVGEAEDDYSESEDSTEGEKGRYVINESTFYKSEPFVLIKPSNKKE